MLKKFFCLVVCVALCGLIWMGTGCPSPTPVKDGGGESPAAEKSPEKGPAKIEPTLASIEENVFKKSCSFSTCHGGGAGGLTLGAGQSHKNLVGVASSLESDQQRVVAGDPDKSLLYNVLKAKVGSVRQMPPEAPITQEKMDAVRDWIKQGAKP